MRRMCEAFEARGAAAVIALEEVPRDRLTATASSSRAARSTSSSSSTMWSRNRAPPMRRAPSRLRRGAAPSPAIFDALARTGPLDVGGEIQLTDAIRRLIGDGGRVYGMVLGADERRFDIGNFEAYFRAFVEFAMADSDLRAVTAGVCRTSRLRTSMIIINRRAYARAALVGNPSYGYQGQVLSWIVCNFWAEVAASQRGHGR